MVQEHRYAHHIHGKCSGGGGRKSHRRENIISNCAFEWNVTYFDQPESTAFQKGEGILFQEFSHGYKQLY